MALDFDQFSVITFDCYGTLINWEVGILGALQPILKKHGRNLSDAGVLELYSTFEPQIQSGPYKPYREVLGRDRAPLRREARLHSDATGNRFSRRIH